MVSRALAACQLYNLSTIRPRIWFFCILSRFVFEKVTFNWIIGQDADPSHKKLCIDLEYRLRPRITRFLMERLERELRGDFSSFHFDVDLSRREIRISEKTPVKYARQVAEDFMLEFGLIPVLNTANKA